jgi:hypothetical protein
MIHGAAGFVSSGSTLRGSVQPGPILPTVFPQSLHSFEDVCGGDDEHDEDDRTAVAMAMDGV